MGREGNKMLLPPSGRGFGKKKTLDEEIQRILEMAKSSLIRRYENGYEAHYIDRHPYGKFYRAVGNASGRTAFPEETIMLLNSQWSVVMFLETTEDLDRIECEMNLKRAI